MVKNARYFPLVDSSGKITNGESRCLADSLRICKIKRNGCENWNCARIYVYRVILFFFTAFQSALRSPYAFVRFAAAKMLNECTTEEEEEEDVTKKIGGRQ